MSAELAHLIAADEARPVYVVTVKGNCGAIHTLEGWRDCRACETPMVPRPKQFIRMWMGDD